MFFPFQNASALGPMSDDLPVIARVREHMEFRQETEILPIMPPYETVRQIGSVDIMLCMRYHSVIMAIAQACPFVAIGYSEKIENTLLDIHLQRAVIGIDDLTDSRLLSMLEAEFRDRLRKRQEREELAAHLAEIAYKNIARVFELMGNPKRGRADDIVFGEYFFRQFEGPGSVIILLCLSVGKGRLFCSIN